MISNYLRTTFRSLVKYKVFTFINVLGFAISIAATICILHFVSVEMSYDRFHLNHERIYRLGINYYRDESFQQSLAKNYPAAALALKNDFPEVQEVARVSRLLDHVSVTYNTIGFTEKKVLFADASLFEVFTLPLVKGKVTTGFAEPFTAVLSQSAAKKYFGKEEPIGKLFTVMGVVDFTVVGVIKDLPKNSHMQFNILLSSASIDKLFSWVKYNTQWDQALSYIYVLLKPQSDVATLEDKLPQFIDKYTGVSMKKYNYVDELVLQPLTDIHLYSDTDDELEKNGNAAVVYLMIGLTLFILILSYLNYINLSTAKGIERAKEIAIRKLMGSTRRQLITQFLLEPFFISLFAVVAALLFIFSLLPYVNQTITEVSFQELISNEVLWAYLTFILFVGSFVSGIFPAIMLASFEPISSLKGTFIGVNKYKGRKIFIFFQFIIATSLTIGAYSIHKQVSYIVNEHPGIDIANTLVINYPSSQDNYINNIEKAELFKIQMTGLKGVKNTTICSTIPGQTNTNIRGSKLANESSRELKELKLILIDSNFQSFFNLKLLAGRNFISSSIADQQALLLNKTALGVMGIKDAESALGKKIVWVEGDKEITREIIGVFDDYHQESLKKAHEAIAFGFNQSNMAYYLVKTTEANSIQALQEVKKKWGEIYPGNNFDAFFLDGFYKDQYKLDQNFMGIMNGFALLSITIAVLGLFGSSLYMVGKRTKEIALRKVLGASVWKVMLLILKEFVSIVVLAYIVSIPLMYIAIREWLKNYAFRIDITFDLFVLPGCLLLSIFILTITYNTLKAALTNPVKVLKQDL